MSVAADGIDCWHLVGVNVPGVLVTAIIHRIEAVAVQRLLRARLPRLLLNELSE
ncbi:hypothetical protein ACFV2H_06810 [Streptomyces sp. NPDC059629]|uniref:hypothetical protein n=1 Tax=Streptomyces sp. NPDC059629 TaxID=3346889 RepID=UPI00368D776C